MLTKRQLSELVWDAVNLEGINFTLPEIQTLLADITKLLVLTAWPHSILALKWRHTIS